MENDQSCKTPRWRLLKAQLNNLPPKAFLDTYETADNAVLIDVRRPDEFQMDHLEEAININFFDADMWERLEAMEDKTQFFIYCRSGRRSIRVCTLMKNGGFSAANIYNLDGGITRLRTEEQELKSA